MKTASPSRPIPAAALPLCALLLACTAGCETLYSGGTSSRNRAPALSEQQQLAARANAERQEQAREVALLRAQSEGTSYSLERLGERLDALERRAAEADALRAEIDRLHGEVDALRTGQEESRRQIVDELSAEIRKVVAESSARRPAPVASGSGYEHVVKAGETLSAIAAAYGCPIKKIMDANGIKDANQIAVGKKLFIPD